MLKALRRLTYRSGLSKLARILGVSRFLRKWYYRVAVSRDCVFQVRVHSVVAKFSVRSPSELRRLEGGIPREDDFLRVLMSTLAPGDVFFDIGSDIGLFAILLAKVVGEQGQVIAFEPESRAHKELEDNVSLNRLTNIRIYQKALGQENSKGRLALIGRACSSLLPSVWEARMATASVRESRREGVVDCSPVIASSTTAWETVDIVEGDWLRESEALPIPRAVKIDVEGYEHFVLRGLKSTLANPACELLCMEIHPGILPEKVNVDDLMDLVRSLGFTDLDVHLRQTEIHMIARKAPSRGLGFGGGQHRGVPST